ASVAQASCLWGRRLPAGRKICGRRLGCRAAKETLPVSTPRTKCSGEAPERHRGKMPVLLVIERRLHGVTIRRGGPHSKTQRVERSVRSRSAFCRDVALLCADFLYAK